MLKDDLCTKMKLHQNSHRWPRCFCPYEGTWSRGIYRFFPLQIWGEFAAAASANQKQIQGGSDRVKGEIWRWSAVYSKWAPVWCRPGSGGVHIHTHTRTEPLDESVIPPPAVATADTPRDQKPTRHFYVTGIKRFNFPPVQTRSCSSTARLAWTQHVMTKELAWDCWSATVPRILNSVTVSHSRCTSAQIQAKATLALRPTSEHGCFSKEQSDLFCYCSCTAGSPELTLEHGTWQNTRFSAT